MKLFILCIFITLSFLYILFTNLIIKQVNIYNYYLYLKHCNSIIQHLYTNCKHFPRLPGCCRWCSTTAINTSWSRMTMRHFGTATALHAHAVYIIHFHSFMLFFIAILCICFLWKASQDY